MAHEHESGIANAFDRAAENPTWQAAVFPGDRFIQGADLNDLQTIARNRHTRVGNLVAKDGDRISGASAVVDVAAGSVLLTPGKLYVNGDVFDVPLATIYGVSMVGQTQIGVRVTKTWIGSDDDPSLVGLVPGSLAEGEPGNYREVVTLSWDRVDSGSALAFIQVYTLVDGVIIDQTPPPNLTGITQQIALYDREAHGHYIVQGCRVTALGKTGSAQAFAIEEGVANIFGYKRSRNVALRYLQDEEWDIGQVAAESHTFVGTTPNVFTMTHGPIDAVHTILVTKEKTVSITRGGVANGSDVLPDSSVVSISQVKQGATVYTVTTDWLKTGDSVDWSPGGSEPLGGSSYDVTYRYRAIVAATSFDNTTITVPGGLDGTEVLIEYDYKLPRIDRICMDQFGNAVYVKGVSAATMDKALPPIPPADILALAQVQNDWFGKPTIVNDGVYRRTFEELDRMARTLENHARLIQLERIKSGIDSREPVAKKGTFVDPFTNDFYRDEGEAQTAAVGNGIMELAIDPTFYRATLAAPVMLDWVEEVIIKQELYTYCEKINPYQTFSPLPASMTIDPVMDLWTEQQTDWLSPQTIEFNRGVRTDGGPLETETSANNLVSTRDEQAEFLRQIPITYTIKGFGAGEHLTKLLFDNIDITPVPVVSGDANGEVTGTFVIPSNVTAGTKLLYAEGGSGASAAAYFVGQGTIEVSVMQHVTTINHWTSPPPVQQTTGGSSGGGGGDHQDNWAGGVYNPNPWDPQAQTFTLSEPRHIVGVDFRLCHIGDPNNPLLVQQVSVENGIPTEDSVAEAFLSMVGVAEGWHSARYNFPALTFPAPDAAVVFKTDDADHSIGMARLGDFDEVAQKWVGVQPYSVGVNLSSSNAKTWTPHNDRDLTFRIVAAKFTSTTKTVPLGTFNLVDASDLQVRAVVDLPSAECSVVFEIVRGSGEVWRLLPYQVLKLTEYITETVQLRAVLTGTEKLSPVLYAPVWFIAGKIRTTGTYVTRAFNLGVAVTLTAYIKAFLPAGSTITVEYDKDDDNWLDLTYLSSEVLSYANWTERKHSVDSITATQGRMKITITGGPAARAIFGDFGAAVM